MDKTPTDVTCVIVSYLDLSTFIAIASVSFQFLEICKEFIQRNSLLESNPVPRFSKLPRWSPRNGSPISTLRKLYTCPNCDVADWNINEHLNCWSECKTCKRIAPNKVLRYHYKERCVWGCMPSCAKCGVTITYDTMHTFVFQHHVIFHIECGMPLKCSRDAKLEKAVEVWTIASSLYSDSLARLVFKNNRDKHSYMYGNNTRIYVINAMRKELIAHDPFHPFINFLDAAGM